MNSVELMHKFRSALPAVREWIEYTLEQNCFAAVSVDTSSFPRLKNVFPIELLVQTKVVVVQGKVPFPPLSQMGLPEFSQMENMSMPGITYKDTFFVNHSHQTESLYFHELVHVVQWERLGLDRFLLAYGAGLMQFGYEGSPLEKMAYSLQLDFDKGVLSANTVEIIQQQTDAVWKQVSLLLS
ncbi:conserved hypothetical protein [Desulfonatronospira thiodismutans ASO3-1]|uniref:DUF4157 domain-containing protein n=1 Tax=Desulfonatronospira thiodismutans ASO3-1 TaxID=555779 RepID=D6SNT2_9BACT|nr:hypothetical protein [Desulfonatronospira thiodismutans]EFI34408.1 conserved hypothetical protein [Desulfonatronospira thiodismutans ASO3-1]